MHLSSIRAHIASALPTVICTSVAVGVVVVVAVIIAVDLVFVIQAVRTYPGEVSVTPYEDGLAYNKRIAQLEAQEQLGWTAGVAAEPGAVLVKLRDELASWR